MAIIRKRRSIKNNMLSVEYTFPKKGAKKRTPYRPETVYCEALRGLDQLKYRA